MSAAALIAEARAAGVTLSLIAEDRIRWTCPEHIDPSPDLLTRLKANKPAVVQALRSEHWSGLGSPLETDPTRRPVGADADKKAYAVAERSAIAEHMAGFPRDWADALAEITSTRPAGIALPDWERRTAAVWLFADRHAAALHAAGWAFGEVFGLGATWARLDRRGAGWFAGNADALEFTPDCLRWRAPDGASRTLWRTGRGPNMRGSP